MARPESERGGFDHDATGAQRGEAVPGAVRGGGGQASLEQLLGRTAGIWPGGDGLAYQREVRGEWETGPEKREG